MNYVLCTKIGDYNYVLGVEDGVGASIVSTIDKITPDTNMESYKHYRCKEGGLVILLSYIINIEVDDIRAIATGNGLMTVGDDNSFLFISTSVENFNIVNGEAAIDIEFGNYIESDIDTVEYKIGDDTISFSYKTAKGEGVVFINKNKIKGKLQWVKSKR